METLHQPPTPKKSKNPQSSQPKKKKKNNLRPKTKQKTKETTPITITRILKYLTVYSNCSKKYFLNAHLT